MRHYASILSLPAAALLLAIAATSCKTTEENYRSAYEKAIAGRDSVAAIDNTVYGAHRNMDTRVAVAGADTADIRTIHVAVTEGGGGIREYLHPYSVVVGQFKQLFNARSMRERLADGGYPRAFVVETAEPYYYIILESYATQAEAVKAAANLPSSLPVAVKAPCPFVLHNPGRH